MLPSRANLSLTVAAASAIALGAMLVCAAPADATVVDPAPINEIAGSSTMLAEIYGLAIGPDGTTYVSNFDEKSIVGFAAGANGNVSPTIDISGIDAGLDYPQALAVDSHGNLWVVNYYNSIEEFAPGATGDASPIRTISGASTELDDPTGIAIGADGSIYVANYDGETVEIFPASASGDIAPTRTIAGANTDFGSLYPYGIVLEPDGSIVVSDYENAIQTFAADASGNVAPLRTIAGISTDLDEPFYAAVDNFGNIYAANYEGGLVSEFPESADGNVAPTTEITGSTSHIDGPYPIATDSADHLFVGNYLGNTVDEYAANLAVTGVTSASGSTAGGETVTVHGYGFAAGATVTFGGTPATDVQVTSSTTITVVAPAHAAGKVDVAVTQDGVTATGTDAFTYAVILATTGVDPAPELDAGILLFLLGGALLVTRRRMSRRIRA